MEDVSWIILDNSSHYKRDVQDFEPSPTQWSESEYFTVIIVTVAAESIRAECKSVYGHQHHERILKIERV